MNKRKLLLAFGATLLLTTSLVAAPPPGYHTRVPVSAPTRIDWTFALTSRSLAEPPADWLGKYSSTDQTFDLFVPGRPDPKLPFPAIIFISPADQPAGWKQLEQPCKQLGYLFVGIRGAGNAVDPKKRIRIVLDVLDEVRRLYPIDPDRTYIGGFSGGGRIACAIAFALPEYFGGVIPVCAGGSPREESWLRHRVLDRLSVAFLTGESDFNRGEVERFRGPYFKDIGVRSRVWVEPRLGHGIPPAKTLQEVLRWLDEGAAQRRQLAKQYPAQRMPSDQAPTRESSARMLFAEAQQRMQAPASLYSGLMQMQGCMARWPDLDQGKKAKEILIEYDARKERPWEREDIAEQRRFLIAQARSLDGYASGDLPPQYAKLRPDMIRGALDLWKQILADGPQTPAGKEASQRIPALEKLLGDGSS